MPCQRDLPHIQPGNDVDRGKNNLPEVAGNEVARD